MVVLTFHLHHFCFKVIAYALEVRVQVPERVLIEHVLTVLCHKDQMNMQR